jgi:hypothetical protein
LLVKSKLPGQTATSFPVGLTLSASLPQAYSSSPHLKDTLQFSPSYATFAVGTLLNQCSVTVTLQKRSAFPYKLVPILQHETALLHQNASNSSSRCWMVSSTIRSSSGLHDSDRSSFAHGPRPAQHPVAHCVLVKLIDKNLLRQLGAMEDGFRVLFVDNVKTALRNKLVSRRPCVPTSVLHKLRCIRQNSIARQFVGKQQERRNTQSAVYRRCFLD